MPRCVKISHLSCASLRDSSIGFTRQRWMSRAIRNGFKTSADDGCSAMSASRVTRSTINASLHPVVMPREDCPWRYSLSGLPALRNFSSKFQHRIRFLCFSLSSQDSLRCGKTVDWILPQHCHDVFRQFNTISTFKHCNVSI